jgi:pimeloyl-ACP methyl ester carboxylesterase
LTDTPTIHTGYADVHGAKLYYEVAGAGYPLVLLHAGIADSRMWDDQFEAFARKFLTVRYDMRGFGRSALPPHAEFCLYDDLGGLLDALGLDTAMLVGLSLGAATALDFTLAHRTRVDALVICAPPLTGFAWSNAILEGWGAVDDAVEQGDKTAAIELDLCMWVDGPSREPDQVDESVRERVREMLTPLYDLPEGAGTERRLDPPAIHRLREVHTPTLILVGDQDMPDMMGIADTLEAGIRNARKIVISGAAHMTNMEKPEQFNAAVLEFLEDV